MIKTIPLALLILMLACSFASATSYLIETTDGREIETSTYWTEGGEIKIEVGEGIILGIPTGEVKRIKKVAGRKQSHAIEKIPEEAALGATPLNQEQTLPDGSTHATTADPIYRTFEVGVTAFQKRVFQQINTLSKKELLAVAADGVALKERLLKTNQVQQLNPLLRKLDNTLDMLENAINEAH